MRYLVSNAIYAKVKIILTSAYFALQNRSRGFDVVLFFGKGQNFFTFWVSSKWLCTSRKKELKILVFYS